MPARLYVLARIRVMPQGVVFKNVQKDSNQRDGSQQPWSLQPSDDRMQFGAYMRGYIGRDRVNAV